jgi:hypothetical protein
MSPIRAAAAPAGLGETSFGDRYPSLHPEVFKPQIMVYSDRAASWDVEHERSNRQGAMSPHPESHSRRANVQR